MVERALSLLPLPSGGLSRLAVAILWAVCFFVLALASLWMNMLSGSASVMWLPNALALARVLTLRESGRPADVLAALGIGTAAAHGLTGFPIHVAAALGLVHMLEVGAGALFFRRFLLHRLPHDDEATYLRFVAAVAIPSAAAASIPGGVLLTLGTDASTARAAMGWLVGNAVGIAGFAPLAIWLMSPPGHRYTVTLREIQWTVTALTMLLTVLGIALAVQQEVQGVLMAILLTSLFALRTGRVGSMALSVVLVPTLSLTGVLERDLLLAVSGLGLGTEIVTFAAVYTCMVLPANLIAAMIARLQMAERTQRDIAAMKVQFLSTMSHEIKTPMNAIHGMFELFSRSELTDRQRRWADAGLSASRNLQAQVTQILEMARLEENTIQVTPRPVDPRKLLQNWIVTTEAGIVVTGKNLSVGGEVAANLPDRVILDEARVQQILINLLTNAVKFSEDGQIGIAMRVLRGALVIEVSDTGIGIAAEDQGLVFERFWQVDSGADRRKDGTGLGLAISRELATLMGGSLTLRSDIAQGSTFRLTLPLLPIGTGDAAP